jgi:hypothetical protein
MRAITRASSMSAMSRSRPPHRAQTSTSIPNVRAIRLAHW